MFTAQAYHDPSDEPTAEPLDPSFFDFDNGDPLGKEQLKCVYCLCYASCTDAHMAVGTVLIYEEVMKPRAQPVQ